MGKWVKTEGIGMNTFEKLGPSPTPCLGGTGPHSEQKSGDLVSVLGGKRVSNPEGNVSHTGIPDNFLSPTFIMNRMPSHN